MDFLLAGIASVLFPYVFKESNFDFNTYLGINISMMSTNNYSAKIIEQDPKKQYALISTTMVTEDYGIRPEFFVDVPIQYGRVFISPSIAWEPIVFNMKYSSKIIDNSESLPNNDQLTYKKGPSFALKFGFSIIKADPSCDNNWDNFGITPYLMGGVQRIYYDKASYFAGASTLFRFFPLWGAGIKIDAKGPWSVYLQYRNLKFDTRGSNLTNQLEVTDKAFQVGLSYRLASEYVENKSNRTETYNEIIDAITPDFKSIEVIKKAPKDLSPLVVDSSNMYPKIYDLKDKPVYKFKQQTQSSEIENIISKNKELKSESDKPIDKKTLNNAPSKDTNLDKDFNF